jgi:hypothetical protein
LSLPAAPATWPLVAGNIESLAKPQFRLRLRGPRLPQEQYASKARDFRFPVAFLMLLRQSTCLSQRLEAVCRVAHVGQGVGLKRDVGAECQPLALPLLYDHLPIDKSRVWCRDGIAWAPPPAGSWKRCHDVEAAMSTARLHVHTKLKSAGIPATHALVTATTCRPQKFHPHASGRCTSQLR